MTVRGSDQLLADELDVAPGRGQRTLWQQPHHGKRGDGFSRSAFADQTQGLAFAHFKGDVIDDAWAASAEADDEILDCENRGGHWLPPRCFRRGSSASRAASPIRLTERLAIESTSPGQKIKDGLI